MKYLCCLSFLFFSLINYGQTNFCGTVAPKAEAEKSLNRSSDCAWCDDIPGMIENCDEIWINVTMHFISNDDCSNEIQLTFEDSDGYNSYMDAEEAIERSQNMFDNANALLEGMNESLNWGMDCWETEGGVTYSEPVCMPLRFRFAGVEFHCNDGDLGVENFPQYQSNNDNHVHVTFAEYPGSGNGVAVPGSNLSLIENFSGDLLTHELLHLFGIHHTGVGHANGCDDLPIFPQNMEWYNPITYQTEEIDNCYLGNPTYYDDETGESIDLCDPAIVMHSPHPCCDSCNYSNNTMSYSGFNNEVGVATLTPCQINTVLTNLCEDNCDLIDSVIPQNGCPPATAFAFQPPGALYEFGDCEICFVLSGSDYATAYHIALFDDTGKKLYQGPWIKERPSSFCIQPTSDNSWDYGLEPNSSYTLSFVVRNKCGDFDHFSLDFNTPSDCDELTEPCYNLPAEIISVNNIFSDGQFQREFCWKDVDADFYEFTYQYPGQDPVTIVVDGTCAVTGPTSSPVDLLNVEVSVVAICDCKDEELNFELSILGDPCIANATLCLNFSDELLSEFYEIEWYGPNGLIAVVQNGPTCIDLGPYSPDGEYYATITFYWGPKYKKVKCGFTTSSIRKNCNCPQELTLDYSGGEEGYICRGNLQICVSDNYGYVGSNQYYSVNWFFNGTSTGELFNEGECMTFPPGVSNVSVAVTYYSGPKYDRAYCQLIESISFNCVCPEDILIEQDEKNCKLFCLKTVPEDLLIPGYFKVKWTTFAYPPQSSTDLCQSIINEGSYNVTIEIYSDLDHKFLLCSFTKSVRVDCNGGEGGGPRNSTTDDLDGQLITKPNPFRDNFYIESTRELNGTLIIYNALGKVMFNNKVNLEEGESLEISANNFSAGVYIVKVYNDSGTQFESKMIKLD